MYGGARSDDRKVAPSLMLRSPAKQSPAAEAEEWVRAQWQKTKDALGSQEKAGAKKVIDGGQPLRLFTNQLSR